LNLLLPLCALQEKFKGTAEKRGQSILACPSGVCYCCIQTLVKMSDAEDELSYGFLACETPSAYWKKRRLL
jgi:hypothetical protein